MNGYSPYGPTPSAEYYCEKGLFATPMPSSRGPVYYYASTPQRPQTRAHFRHASYGMNDYPSPHPAAFSPRYNSEGLYSTNTATTSVNATRSSRSKSSSGSRPNRDHRGSHSYSMPFDRGETLYYEELRRPAAHAHRASQSMPQRPQTARPSAPHHHKAPPATRKATEADAKLWGILKGYSLKNWDPTEEPILLLGSVFDANSLGRWVYDWTVYSRGSSTPISEVAGELWLLLIQLSGKIKRATEAIPRIRTQANKEIFKGFISSGKRLTDELQKLLKLCEKPMLTAGSKKDSQLGQRSGIEFVQTLFGRDRELDKTERFMQSVRLWNLRFDANCEDTLRHPEQ